MLRIGTAQARSQAAELAEVARREAVAPLQAELSSIKAAFEELLETHQMGVHAAAPRASQRTYPVSQRQELRLRKLAQTHSWCLCTRYHWMISEGLHARVLSCTAEDTLSFHHNYAELQDVPTGTGTGTGTLNDCGTRRCE